MKRWAFLLCLLTLLTACATDPFDVRNISNLGVSCSKNAQTPPDWSACLEQAKKICGTQQVTHIAQQSPTGSGYQFDSYYMTFQCH